MGGPGFEESAEELLDDAPCGYLSAAPDGTLRRVNRTFLRWTGYEREDLVGVKRFQDLLSVGGRIYHETHYAPMLRMQGTVREVAFDVVRPDGSRLPVLVNAALERTAGGEPRVVRIAVFDATERREYERELVRRVAGEGAERGVALDDAAVRIRRQVPAGGPLVQALGVVLEQRIVERLVARRGAHRTKPYRRTNAAMASTVASGALRFGQ